MGKGITETQTYNWSSSSKKHQKRSAYNLPNSTRKGSFSMILGHFPPPLSCVRPVVCLSFVYGGEQGDEGSHGGRGGGRAIVREAMVQVTYSL